MPRCRVIDGAFDWEDDRQPAVPWRDTFIYELHVKGFTQLHPDVPPEWRGKYLALTVPAVLDHLKSLGVTAVELMPVHAFTERRFPARARPHQLLGLQHTGVVRAHQSLCREGPGGRAQAGGQGAARGGHRGDPRRGLQPHRRGQSAWADVSTFTASTTARITFIAPMTGGSTTTSPAAGTPWPATIPSCRPTSWPRCAISPKNSASTGSASTSPPCWAATVRASIPIRRSSRCCAPIRCWPT